MTSNTTDLSDEAPMDERDDDVTTEEDPRGEIENPEELPLLVLASASPGRAKILKDAGIDFDVQVSTVDEDAALAAATERFGALGPADTALLLAKAKAEGVAALEETDGAVVLGCDSVFEFEGVAYGKPYTAQVATERWEAMSGKSGILHTGHWLIDNRSEDDEDGGSGATIGAVSSTVVNFEKVTAEEIAAYVATGEPLAVRRRVHHRRPRGSVHPRHRGQPAHRRRPERLHAARTAARGRPVHHGRLGLAGASRTRP